MNPSRGAYGEFFLEYSLMAEYKLLAKQKLPGVYVVPSGRSPLCWNGVIFVRQGIYQSGIFKVSVFIPPDYPDGQCPKLMFDPPVYHPLVNPLTGELDVHRAFSRWRRNVNHIWQVLMYARRIFHKVEITNPWNPEAGYLYENDFDTYKVKVAESIDKGLAMVYNDPDTDDPLAIKFTELNDQQFAQAKEALNNFRVTGSFKFIEPQSNQQTPNPLTMRRCEACMAHIGGRRRLGRRQRSSSRHSVTLMTLRKF